MDYSEKIQNLVQECNFMLWKFDGSEDKQILNFIKKLKSFLETELKK